MAEREIVLTFDDGPRPLHAEKVLQRRAQECVRATFFLVGKSSAPSQSSRGGWPRGHTIAQPGWSHSMA
ncbi:polysaccharide deacetylase family protein [Bradyrhizobium sp. F1.13.3]|uniref:polysaccharide deacetylase family protein n=1 Tax=Bradyrhizobium sp. F1.13.3 TaxID=3156351 RepID=UPI0033924E88